MQCVEIIGRLAENKAPDSELTELEQLAAGYRSYFGEPKNKPKLLRDSPSPDEVDQAIREITSTAKIIQRLGKNSLTEPICINLVWRIGPHDDFSPQRETLSPKKTTPLKILAAAYGTLNVDATDAYLPAAKATHLRENSIAHGLATTMLNLVLALEEIVKKTPWREKEKGLKPQALEDTPRPSDSSRLL